MVLTFVLQVVLVKEIFRFEANNNQQLFNIHMLCTAFREYSRFIAG